MLRLLAVFISIFLLSCASQPPELTGENDPHLWLEEIEGEKPLNWVKAQNQKTSAEVAQGKRFKSLHGKALKILEAKEKIPRISIKGQYVYNFWQDAQNKKGVWRRTTIKSFRANKPKWEKVLDLDMLAKSENENWFYKGSNCLTPENEICLIKLSRGGKDGVVVREFNTKTKTFVKDGFKIPESKTWTAWLDKDHLFVASDFGEGSLTESGYPRMVKLWKRGEPLSKAKTSLEIDKKNMGAYPFRVDFEGGSMNILASWKTFYTSEYMVYQKGELKTLPVQDSAQLMHFFKNKFILELRKDWLVDGTKYPQGSLVAVASEVVENQKVTKADLQLVYKPKQGTSILRVGMNKDSILVNSLENVKGKIYRIPFEKDKFAAPQAINFATQGHISLFANSDTYEDFFLLVNGFLKPDSVFVYSTQQNKAKLVKRLPSKFNSKGMVASQRWVTSKDGTKVPYFLVGKKSVIEKGNAPTLLYGYGGFELSLTPKYDPIVGKLWLEQGGVFVLANIRGGGEFGPSWHQSALKTNREKVYDDFIAVGEDLVNKKITSKDKLAIYGRSNGGLLVGAVMTRRPDLFKSVLCHVPLLDMMRYSQLLAGASWVGEYGDPRDDKMREYIKTYSPYQNVSADKKYPHVFFYTSTKDDRVHPGHARKMAAKMLAQKHPNILYFENVDGGHKTTDSTAIANKWAMSYEFLFKTLQ